MPKATTGAVVLSRMQVRSEFALGNGLRAPLAHVETGTRR